MPTTTSKSSAKSSSIKSATKVTEKSLENLSKNLKLFVEFNQNRIIKNGEKFKEKSVESDASASASGRVGKKRYFNPIARNELVY